MNTENREDLQQLVGDGYQLQWIIGHGGMSTVWLADDLANEREVAIKVLRPEFSSNAEFLARFRNEALSAQGINSDNVVATYDYREADTDAGFTVCYIIMEYIRGESLADLIAREGQLDEALALDVLEQAAHGLAVIHRMGLVHRDIKPGNLMLTQHGQVKITDFGIAKAAAAVPLTRTGMVVGTAQYVSPEQAQGMKVTAASDVYSLGVVGYELLSGKRPFTGDSSVSVALAHVSAEPPALPISVSAPARELIEIALRKDPGQRFRDGNEFQLAISQVRQGLRPAQPGGHTQVVATEPSATASTQMLASVAEERTSRPEGAYPPSAATPAPREHEADKKSSKAGPVISAILLLALLAGGAAWAYTEGVFDRFTGGGTPTTPRPTMSATTPTPEEEADTEDPVTETTTERERTTITEPRNPGTLRFEESEADNAPAPAEPSAEPPAPGTSAPEQPSAATPTQQGGAPAGEPSIGNQPEVTNSPAPAVELPNLDSLLGGGR
ncbi:serine/threonine-protein kinase [Corynebacterium haemomassiliense]|uniref:non-specific serine/threonine protein kinase n=1 Tax=Corynebacterium haemomassiliense TaxID=2754726 RepID=A0A7W2EBY6_9CORY|nr:serine/threonine-protein kinase [Corynebacterium haemomassiliense]MBA5244886.1 protein kinase [Corynebacterium haemomassiliense]MDL0403657.1 protein kinase [Corynebacterium lehmanniae]